jgi:CRP/FNR family cyclic AMP-dependent transcriptional regulator
MSDACSFGGLVVEDNIKPLSDIPAINRFLSYCRIRTVPSKTVVIHAGDLPDVLYYIISGSVEVMIEDEEGNEMVLAYLNKGQFFGEMGLFYEQPTRTAWVRTRGQCELAEMTYPRFRQIAAESPGLIFELATQLATRLDRTNRKLGDLAFVDVTGRVAHAIMDLCGEPDAMTHPEGMQIKVSRQELSRLVGCSREMAGRVLKVLEEQGLLRATGKTIVVFNARPKMKTRPVIVPASRPPPGGKAPRRRRRLATTTTTTMTTTTRMTSYALSLAARVVSSKRKRDPAVRFLRACRP